MIGDNKFESKVENKSNDVKMDMLMKAIKAVHSISANQEDEKHLQSHRASTERFSALVTPRSDVTFEDFMVGAIPCQRVIPTFPHRKDYLILYCHGGGYTSGELKYAGILAAKLAGNTGLEVISFAYRLAPEATFPAAIVDAVAVWDDLMLKGYGSKQIIVCGDSAGGNLTLELCLFLKAKERFLPKAIVLFSPWTDMTCTSEGYQLYAEVDPVLTPDYIQHVRASYVGLTAEEDQDALASYDFSNYKLSPLFASDEQLQSFPPTLIQVGSNEILRPDSEQMAKRLKKNKCRVKLEVYSDAWHVFQQMPISKATKAMQAVQTFVMESINE